MVISCLSRWCTHWVHWMLKWMWYPPIERHHANELLWALSLWQEKKQEHLLPNIRKACWVACYFDLLCPFYEPHHTDPRFNCRQSPRPRQSCLLLKSLELVHLCSMLFPFVSVGPLAQKPQDQPPTSINASASVFQRLCGHLGKRCRPLGRYRWTPSMRPKSWCIPPAAVATTAVCRSWIILVAQHRSRGSDRWLMMFVGFKLWIKLVLNQLTHKRNYNIIFKIIWYIYIYIYIYICIYI